LRSIVRAVRELRPIAGAVALSLLAAIALSCSNRKAPSDSKGRQSKQPSTATNTRSCAPNNNDPASRYVSISIAGKMRRFYLVPPVGTGKAVDLIIGFHGRDRSGEHIAQNWALGQEGVRPYVAVFPDGSHQKWFRGLFGWDTRAETSTDLAFFDALVDWAATNYCIDRSRIHVIGHSWGAGMANLVACARKGVRTLVSVGGGGPTFPCQAAVAAMIVHGVDDQDEPLSSGQLAVTTWGFYNRCGTGQTPAPVEGCVQYADCLNETPLLWCEHPGGHGWPNILREGKLLRWLQRP